MNNCDTNIISRICDYLDPASILNFAQTNASNFNLFPECKQRHELLQASYSNLVSVLQNQLNSIKENAYTSVHAHTLYRHKKSSQTVKLPKGEVSIPVNIKTFPILAMLHNDTQRWIQDNSNRMQICKEIQPILKINRSLGEITYKVEISVTSSKKAQYVTDKNTPTSSNGSIPTQSQKSQIGKLRVQVAKIQKNAIKAFQRALQKLVQS